MDPRPAAKAEPDLSLPVRLSPSMTLSHTAGSKYVSLLQTFQLLTGSEIIFFQGRRRGQVPGIVTG